MRLVLKHASAAQNAIQAIEVKKTEKKRKKDKKNKKDKNKSRRLACKEKEVGDNKKHDDRPDDKGDDGAGSANGGLTIDSNSAVAVK